MKKSHWIIGVAIFAAGADFSHCQNTIALDNHTDITVIDNHNMNRSACLKPGERVVVQSVTPTSATVTT